MSREYSSHADYMALVSQEAEKRCAMLLSTFGVTK